MLIKQFESTLESRAMRDAFCFLADGENVDERVTYEDISELAKHYSHLLRKRGKFGDRALLLFPTGLEYIIAFVACIYAGIIAVPIFPPRMNRTHERIIAIAKDSEAEIALTTNEILESIEPRITASKILSSLEWMEVGKDVPLGEQFVEKKVSDETIAFLQYTSGSTASPRGVMVTHRNILSNIEMMKQAWKTNRDTIFISWLPFHHDMGMVGNVLHSLVLGAKCYFMSPAKMLEKPLRWLEAVNKYRGTCSGGPNFAYDLLSNINVESIEDHFDLSSWTAAYNGAEPINSATMKRFVKKYSDYGLAEEYLFPGYGLAEATLFVSSSRNRKNIIYEKVSKKYLQENKINYVNDETEKGAATYKEFVAVGKSEIGQLILIVDQVSNETRPDGQIGEIWISGPNVAKGYWNNPEESRRVFEGYTHLNDGPYLRTGDLGFMKDKQLFIVGRIKDLIVIKGNNYYPQDIELSCENSHEALRSGAGAAFSIDSQGEEKLVVAYEI